MNLMIIKTNWVKGIYLLFSLLFFFSAAVQYNDPDPFHWIFLYGLSAIVCLLAASNRLKISLLYICLGAVILQLLIVAEGAFEWYVKGGENFLSTPMSKEKPYIEEVREFLGSFLVFLSLILLFFVAENKSPSNQ